MASSGPTKVLVAYDGSELSRSAVYVYAKQYSNKNHHVYVLYTVHRSRIEVIEDIPLEESKFRKRLKDVRSFLRKFGVPALGENELFSIVEDVATEILRVADEFRADMIVMARHGKPCLTKCNSLISTYVLMHADCSVLLYDRRDKGSHHCFYEHNVITRDMSDLQITATDICTLNSNGTSVQVKARKEIPKTAKYPIPIKNDLPVDYSCLTDLDFPHLAYDINIPVDGPVIAGNKHDKDINVGIASNLAENANYANTCKLSITANQDRIANIRTTENRPSYAETLKKTLVLSHSHAVKTTESRILESIKETSKTSKTGASRPTKVLVAYDGSIPSQYALYTYVKNYSNEHHNVYVLHTVHLSRIKVEGDIRGERTKSRKEFQRVRCLLREFGVPALVENKSFSIVEDVGAEILKVANEFKADMIVMARHGNPCRTKCNSLISTYVLMHADCSVFIYDISHKGSHCCHDTHNVNTGDMFDPLKPARDLSTTTVIKNIAGAPTYTEVLNKSSDSQLLDVKEKTAYIKSESTEKDFKETKTLKKICLPSSEAVKKIVRNKHGKTSKASMFSKDSKNACVPNYVQAKTCKDGVKVKRSKKAIRVSKPTQDMDETKATYGIADITSQKRDSRGNTRDNTYVSAGKSKRRKTTDMVRVIKNKASASNYADMKKSQGSPLLDHKKDSKETEASIKACRASNCIVEKRVYNNHAMKKNDGSSAHSKHSESASTSSYVRTQAAKHAIKITKSTKTIRSSRLPKDKDKLRISRNIKESKAVNTTSKSRAINVMNNETDECEASPINTEHEHKSNKNSTLVELEITSKSISVGRLKPTNSFTYELSDSNYAAAVKFGKSSSNKEAKQVIDENPKLKDGSKKLKPLKGKTPRGNAEENRSRLCIEDEEPIKKPVVIKKSHYDERNVEAMVHAVRTVEKKDTYSWADEVNEEEVRPGLDMSTVSTKIVKSEKSPEYNNFHMSNTRRYADALKVKSNVHNATMMARPASESQNKPSTVAKMRASARCGNSTQMCKNNNASRRNSHSFAHNKSASKRAVKYSGDSRTPTTPNENKRRTNNARKQTDAFTTRAPNNNSKPLKKSRNDLPA